NDIAGISFAAKNASRQRQRGLYVTERCVFELTPDGLRLKEVFDGIDEQKQVRDLLDFEV
ncbi:MAG: propionate CoA-transferase, partial [Planctomycetes bacterium]|nr:propionate CoA-transferase [Planctomycetota bacterium]